MKISTTITYYFFNGPLFKNLNTNEVPNGKFLIRRAYRENVFGRYRYPTGTERPRTRYIFRVPNVLGDCIKKNFMIFDEKKNIIIIINAVRDPNKIDDPRPIVMRCVRQTCSSERFSAQKQNCRFQ